MIAKVLFVFSNSAFGLYLVRALETLFPRMNSFLRKSSHRLKKGTDRHVLQLIDEIHARTEMLLDENDALHLYMAVKATGKVPGDLAEVGVYKGGSASLICEVKGSRRLHLFDSFDGLPKSDASDSIFINGAYKTDHEKVKQVLREYEDCRIYKGLFPATATGLSEERFSFVHIDIDLYKGTKDCLEFFYPRLNKGAIMLCHDYSTARGVRKAIAEFFEDKPDTVVQLSGLYCMIVRVN